MMLHRFRALSFSAETSLFAFAALFVAVGLHGCGGSTSTTTSAARSTTTAPKTTPKSLTSTSTTAPKTTPKSLTSTSTTAPMTTPKSSTSTNTTAPMTTPKKSTSTNTTAPMTTPKSPNSSTSTSTPTGSSTALSTTASPPEFTLNPIVVKSNHLFDSVTGERFQIIGVGFPDGLQTASVETWIEILVNIKEKGPKVNVVRLYEFPLCFFDNRWCFTPFMQKADQLGIYVLVPGTTRQRYIDVTKPTAQEGYETAKALDFGRQVVQGTLYPNTLAIAIGNEYFDAAHPDSFRFVNAIKAYARDLKAYMTTTCNIENPIPLMYAARDLGDVLLPELMEALSCGTADTSIDLFGNNNERWCDNSHSIAYNTVEQFLENLQIPLPFFFSEMGCSQFVMGPRDQCSTKVCARQWNEIVNFFENFKMMDGFVAYTYWRDGPVDFNMFDGRYANATLNHDGKNFFDKIAGVKQVSKKQVSLERPECKQQFASTDMFPVEDYKAYNMENWKASTCPDPHSRSPSRHELPIGNTII